jgi:hypothetical protein
MKKADVRNIVMRVVSAAPSGGTLNEIDVRKWRKTPFVHELRKAVQPNDIPVLLSLAKNADWPVANLAVGLLRAFKNDLEIRQHYLDIWNDERRPMELRFCVMYPLLDDPDLPRKLHEEFFTTILANLDVYKRTVSDYYITPEHVLPTVRKRIKDPQYPVTKRWVYLCNALSSPDKLEAREFIEPFKDDLDPFVKKVALTLIEKVFRKI